MNACFYIPVKGRESVNIDGQELNQCQHMSPHIIQHSQYHKINGYPDLIQAQTGGGVKS